MRKLLSLTMIGLMTAALTGCECCDAFMRFEACKNEMLFGCLRDLCGGPTCAPACAPAPICAPAPVYAPAAVDPCATQYGPQMVTPYGDCYGGTPVVTGSACQDGCGTSIPGQVIPGQVIVTPGAATLAPTPVPTLLP